MTDDRVARFEQRRRELAEMTDEQLKARFWELCGQVMDPVVELARTHTSPSIERSVLLRMGIDSLSSHGVVERIHRAGLLGNGAGHVVLMVAERQGTDVEERGGRDPGGRGGPRWPGPGGIAMTDDGQPPGPQDKLDLEEILKDLERYRPPRAGWPWRSVPPTASTWGPFTTTTCPRRCSGAFLCRRRSTSSTSTRSPSCVVSTEIASGRFEDDLRRMRMAAWHGADHLMVIRTTGQSHIDGLMEGTPEGIGGVAITRKQIRATRKACDLIEAEVGRALNFHSYVSGVAGPEVAVLFAEEGVNGAHQDPQYNVLYRNVDMYRSFVDAGEAKRVMARADIFQIDGAHNANATAKAGWLVMPELIVQHGINCAFSVAVGMPKELIGLSTVPPDAAPAPKLWYDLPYAVALRDFFSDYKIRAQQNTRYIEADVEEAVRNHTIDTLISILTSADIQSTITPDEGRNVPWHYNNIRAVQTVKQTWAALDGVKDLLEIKTDGPLGAMARDIKERSIAFLEEVLEVGGYFAAVERGFFVDSAKYPERQRRRHRARRPERSRSEHHRPPRSGLHGPRLRPLRGQPSARRAGQALRPGWRLHALRSGEDRLHRRAGPGGLGRPAPGGDAALPQGRHDPTRGGMGGRRHRAAPAHDPGERSARARGRPGGRPPDGASGARGDQPDGPAPGRGLLRRGQGQVAFDDREVHPEDPAQGRAAAR